MILIPEEPQSLSLMPDMTALLDVLFILLIFMLLTANAAPHLLRVDLPQVNVPATQLESKVITLGISQEGQFSIDQRRYETWLLFTGELKARLSPRTNVQEIRPQVLLAADKGAPLGRFVKLAEWLSSQGHEVAEIVVSNKTINEHN